MNKKPDGKGNFNLEKDLPEIREEFPVLKECTYLISNSLGAVPKDTCVELSKYYLMWTQEGVSAWEKEWWDLSGEVGNQVAEILGAGNDEVTMMPHATQCHWVALSTQFRNPDKERRKIVMTDHDFPSILYAVSRISEFIGWEVDLVKSEGKAGIPVEKIRERIDEKTLMVATSHVYFKSAYIQDISRISQKAREMGALTLIDGYHAPGTVPVNVKDLGIDFYVGGCLKWLCGGPGNAFLYVRPQLASSLEPYLTGWVAHEEPFSFKLSMDYANGSYKFMSGTPPVPSLYTAKAGLGIIREVGISQIRKKSLRQTEMIIKAAKNRGFQLFSPEKERFRGGAVSLGLPEASKVYQGLERKQIKVDFRPGKDKAPDVLRIAPHFYTTDEEIEYLFKEIDTIYRSSEF